MRPFQNHIGIAVPLDRANVDTDQIIPKQFLKRIERTGYGDFLFYDWRYNSAGEPNPDFVLNRPKFRGASILIAGKNFGCGSSREHAAWALNDYGIRAVIGSSFADIFATNCTKNGIVPVVLGSAAVEQLTKRAQENPNYEVAVSLERCTVSDEFGFNENFLIDAFKRQCLLEGLDDIGLTLRHEADIAAWERQRATQSWLPKTTPASPAN